MKSLSKRAVKQFRINIQRVAFEGMGLTVILSLLLLIVMSNVIKVIQNGQENFEVYQYEQGVLDNLRRRNEELKERLDIVSSEEYGRLLAREVLGLAEEGEQLYRSEEPVSFFEKEEEYLDLTEKENYLDWWMLVLR